MSIYSNAVLALNPVNYWRMDQASGDSTDLGSRATALSPAGAGLTFLQAGAIPNDANQSILFDGADYLVGGLSEAGTMAFTMECWVNHHDVLWTSTGLLVHFTGPSKWYSFYVYSDGTVFANIPTGSNKLFQTTATVPRSGWHHLVATWESGSAASIYIDGVLSATSSTYVGPLANIFGAYVGNDSTAASPFQGFIDEVAIYDIALTPSQISAHYALGFRGPIGNRMSNNSAVDRTLLNAQSVDETAVAFDGRAGSSSQSGFHHHISWGTGVVSGVVEIECADSGTYAGTWAPMATVTFSGTAPKQDYVFTPGRPCCVRHRISTVISGGTVTTRLAGED